MGMPTKKCFHLSGAIFMAVSYVKSAGLQLWRRGSNLTGHFKNSI